MLFFRDAKRRVSTGRAAWAIWAFDSFAVWGFRLPGGGSSDEWSALAPPHFSFFLNNVP